MNIFTSVYAYIKRLFRSFKKYHPETEAMLEKWISQFASDAGALAMNLAIEYTPKLIRGDITIVAAKDEILAELGKEGTVAGKELVELILNALRTCSVAK